MTGRGAMDTPPATGSPIWASIRRSPFGSGTGSLNSRAVSIHNWMATLAFGTSRFFAQGPCCCSFKTDPAYYKYPIPPRAVQRPRRWPDSRRDCERGNRRKTGTTSNLFAAHRASTRCSRRSEVGGALALTAEAQIRLDRLRGHQPCAPPAASSCPFRLTRSGC